MGMITNIIGQIFDKTPKTERPLCVVEDQQ